VRTGSCDFDWFRSERAGPSKVRGEVRPQSRAGYAAGEEHAEGGGCASQYARALERLAELDGVLSSLTALSLAHDESIDLRNVARARDSAPAPRGRGDRSKNLASAGGAVVVDGTTPAASSHLAVLERSPSEAGLRSRAGGAG
jgi:hypothetical protein